MRFECLVASRTPRLPAGRRRLDQLDAVTVRGKLIDPVRRARHGRRRHEHVRARGTHEWSRSSSSPAMLRSHLPRPKVHRTSTTTSPSVDGPGASLARTADRGPSPSCRRQPSTGRCRHDQQARRVLATQPCQRHPQRRQVDRLRRAAPGLTRKSSAATRSPRSATGRRGRPTPAHDNSSAVRRAPLKSLRFRVLEDDTVSGWIDGQSDSPTSTWYGGRTSTAAPSRAAAPTPARWRARRLSGHRAAQRCPRLDAPSASAANHGQPMCVVDELTSARRPPPRDPPATTDGHGSAADHDTGRPTARSIAHDDRTARPRCNRDRSAVALDTRHAESGADRLADTDRLPTLRVPLMHPDRPY